MLYLLLLAATVSGDMGYEWRPYHDGSDDQALYQNGSQVGWYSLKKDCYRPYYPASQQWGAKCEPPIPPPLRNFGVTLSGTQTGTRYRRGGSDISPEEADAYLSGDTSANPSPTKTTKHVVVIGPESATLEVTKELHFCKLMDKLPACYSIQAFLPDDWQVKDSGYVTGGNPTIYFLDDDGKVLYRRDDADCSTEELVAALRDADPDYQPANDPGPNSWAPSWSDPAFIFFATACVAFVLAVLLFAWGFQRWRISSSAVSH